MNECWPGRSSSFLRSAWCSELWTWQGEGDRRKIVTGRSACFDVQTVVEIDGVKIGPTRSHVALRNMRIERCKSSQTTPASSDSSSGSGSSSEFELALVFEKPGRYTLPILDITRVRCKYLHQDNAVCKASIEAKDSLFVFTAASQDELERLLEVVRDVKAMKMLAESRMCTSCKERGELKKIKRKQKRELQQQQTPTESEPNSWLDGDCQARNKQKLKASTVKVVACASRRISQPSLVDTYPEHVYCVRDLLRNKENGSRKFSNMGVKLFEGGDSVRMQSEDETFYNAFSQDDVSSEHSCTFHGYVLFRLPVVGSEFPRASLQGVPLALVPLLLSRFNLLRRSAWVVDSSSETPVSARDPSCCKLKLSLAACENNSGFSRW